MFKFRLLVVMLFMISLVQAQNYSLKLAYHPDSDTSAYVNQAGDTVFRDLFSVFNRHFIYKVGAVRPHNSEESAFYVNQNHQVFGRDSIWIFDYGHDVEVEGFIRFRTQELEGLFDWKGTVRVPAIYNTLSPARNGFLFGLKGGTKEVDASGEHSYFVGGTSHLLDTNGIMIANLDKGDYDKLYWVDYHDVKRTPDSIPGRQNFKTLSGDYISFMDYREELKALLKNNKLEDILLDSVFLTVQAETGPDPSYVYSERQVAKADFFQNPAYAKFIPHVQKLTDSLEKLYFHYEDINLYEFVLPADQDAEQVENQSKYDMVKPYVEEIPFDQPYRHIPVIEVLLDWNKFYMRLVMQPDRSFRILEMRIRKN